jgi:V/A-type H+-transporting ATPase subunit I
MLFRPAPMLKVRIVVLARDVEPVAHALGNLGVVHLKSSVEESGGQLQPENIADKLRRCNQLMGRLEHMMDVLLVERPPEEAAPPGADGTAAPAGPTMTADEVEALLGTLEQTVGPRVKALESAREGLSGAADLMLQLEPYRDVTSTLAPLLRSSLLEVRAGRMAPERMGDLLSAMPPGTVLLPMRPRERGGKKEPLDVLIVGGRRRRYALQTVLEDQEFEEGKVPAWEGKSPADVYQEARHREDELRRKVDEVQLDLGSTGRAYAGALHQAHATLARQISVYEAAQNFGATWATAVISGWLPVEREQDLRRAVSQATRAQSVVETDRPTEEDIAAGLVPSYLPHSWFLSPFHRLVRGYGVAAYTEIEPTILFCATFLLMFGLMFGDLGDGLCLVAIGLAVKRLSRRAAVRDTGHVVLFAGISSVLFGAFVQGVFFGKSLLDMGFRWTLGFEAIHFGGGAGARGSENVMTYMLLSLILGIVLISLGMVLNVVNRLRRGDVAGGVLDHFGVVGMVFYWGVLALSIKLSVWGAGPLDVWIAVAVSVLPMIVMALKGPLTALLTRRRPLWGEHPVGGLLEGTVGAIETAMVYLANTFSYLRVAAFALSHAALSFTVFVMVDLVHPVPGGAVWAVIIFVLGRAVIIGLEGLIVAVQVLRLEYYEFFTKFFGGEGLPYRPFRLGRGKDSE